MLPSSTGVVPTACFTTQEDFRMLGMSLKRLLRRLSAAAPSPSRNLHARSSDTAFRLERIASPQYFTGLNRPERLLDVRGGCKLRDEQGCGLKVTVISWS